MFVTDVEVKTMLSALKYPLDHVILIGYLYSSGSDIYMAKKKKKKNTQKNKKTKNV